ncbi:MAG: hypothetical protein KKC19_03175 [Nanoarchaeota archaeon]|nr:hypothetical protein [Nanoarchaeota archaeon]
MSSKKEKILKELADKLKQKPKEKSRKKSSPSEKPVDKKEKDEDSNDDDSLEDIIPEDFVPRATSPNFSNTRAPALEAIAGEQHGPVFVNRGRPVSTDSDEKSDVGYAPKNDDSNEPKYSSNQSSKLYDAQNVRTESLGRSTRPGAETKEVNFQPDERTLGESPAHERTLNVERFDETQAGKRNPLEIDEVKYKEYEPK